jgi:hypothetical protein
MPSPLLMHHVLRQQCVKRMRPTNSPRQPTRPTKQSNLSGRRRFGQPCSWSNAYIRLGLQYFLNAISDFALLAA